MEQHPKKNEIMSVKFFEGTRDELIKKIDKRLELKKKTIIFTPNSQILLKTKKSPSLLKLLQFSDINIADGIGVVLASKLLAAGINHRIAGIDLGEDIIKLAKEKKLSVFLLGGRHGVALTAAENLKKAHPSLRICGTHHGYFKGNESTLREEIKKANPDIIFVCLGFPLQEKWIAENIDKLPSLTLAIGLGGSLDVWSKKVLRAPIFIRRIGCEWLWRILCEPKRAKFFLELPEFLFYVLKTKRG